MTEAPSSVVIIGGGLAGAKAAEALRDQGYTGPVTLVGAETDLPYERPPLSKDYLTGKAEFAAAVVHDEAWYAEHDVTLRLGAEAVAVDPAAHEIELADGTRLGYGALVLATGSEPTVPPIPGAAGGRYLRTHADSDALRAAFGPGTRVVIVGGGWIGLEVASAAKGAGGEVTVLEAADQPLLAVLGPETATVFADLHRAHGVDLRTGVSVAAIRPDGVDLADGTSIAADIVVVGTGAAPRLALAVSAGLAVDDATGGVAVDAGLRTSNPDIVAVGDIAAHDHPVLGRRVRVEHWATALKQPTVAVASLLGTDGSYDDLPYFFSDQFDLGMEYVGYAARGEYAQVVVRGDLGAREFVAFWLDAEDHVLAGMNVNVWDVVDDIKPLIANRTVVDPGKLAEPAVPLTAVRQS